MAFVNARVKTELGKVKKMEKGPMMIMEPSATGTHYVQVEIVKNYWKCVECGLVWKTRRDAQNCKPRGHVKGYLRHYGGYIENGVQRGMRSFPIVAIRREAV